jgi:hypothetical protein
LKVCGIVKQSTRIGEYCFILPRDSFHEFAMKKRKYIEVEQNPLPIELMLNRLNGGYLKSVQKVRVAEIQILLNGFF